MYLTITEQDKLDSLAFNVVMREQEVHQYQINIDNYTQMLSVLPQGEVPAEVLPYLDTPAEDLPEALSLDTVQLISDYQYRKRLTYLLRTEGMEQNKSKRVLDALKAQIPADQLESLVAAALVKVQAQQSPAI